MLDNAQNSWEEAWKAAGGWRGSLQAYFDQREYLTPDINLLYRIPATSIIYALSGHFLVKDPAVLDAIAMAESGGGDFKFFSLMNVKYFISEKDLGSANGLKLVDNYNQGNFPVYIYENTKVLPRVFFVGKATNVNTSGDDIKIMLATDFSPANEVVILNGGDLVSSQGRGEIKITDYQD